jgi:hypothetical protein
MKRFFVRLGRFFWSWGFLKFVLGTVILTILFYVEEDWRGAHAWATTKASWEAKGETFDYAKFIPPPVPDEQNLAAIPLFKIKPDKNSTGAPSLNMAALNTAMRTGEANQELPTLGGWQRGVLPDLGKFKTTIAGSYATVFNVTKPPAGTLAQFEALYPFLENLRVEANARSLCRFNLDYGVAPPILRSFGLIARPIRLSQILTIDAILALDEHQPDLALKDIEINHRLLTAAKRDPTIVGGLVALGMVAVGEAAIYDGMANHSWSDAQLDTLEHIEEPINFLADYQFANRSEAAMTAADTAYFKSLPRSKVSALFRLWDSPIFNSLQWSPPWPNGWWDLNVSQLAALHSAEMATVDPTTRLVFPSICRELQNKVSGENARWDAHAPWNIWFTLATDNTLNLTLKYAEGQVWLDETRITCALERYRLAHGVYPGSLGELTPKFIDEVPHDIMNGQSYHYRLNGDGTFLLYSVGWNQKDDSGTVGFDKDYPKIIDYEQADWVWPTPK